MVQKSIEAFTVAISALHTTKKVTREEELHGESVETILSMVEWTQIPFPSFDGSNFRDWKAKANSFLNWREPLKNNEEVYCCCLWMARLLVGNSITCKTPIIKGNIGSRSFRMQGVDLIRVLLMIQSLNSEH